MQYRSSEGMHTSDDAACVAAETKKKPRLATPVEEEHYSTTASPKKRKVMKLSVVKFSLLHVNDSNRGQWNMFPSTDLERMQSSLPSTRHSR